MDGFDEGYSRGRGEDDALEAGAIPHLRQALNNQQHEASQHLSGAFINFNPDTGKLKGSHPNRFQASDKEILVNKEVLAALVGSADALNLAQAQYEYHKQLALQQALADGRELSLADLEAEVLRDVLAGVVPEELPRLLISDQVAADAEAGRGKKGSDKQRSAADAMTAGVPSVLAGRPPSTLWGYFSALSQLVPPAGATLTPLMSPLVAMSRPPTEEGGLRQPPPWEQPGTPLPSPAGAGAQVVSPAAPSESWADLMQRRKRQAYLRRLVKMTTTRNRNFERNHAAKVIQCAWRAHKEGRTERAIQSLSLFSRQMSRNRAGEAALKAAAAQAWGQMVQPEAWGLAGRTASIRKRRSRNASRAGSRATSRSGSRSASRSASRAASRSGSAQDRALVRGTSRSQSRKVKEAVPQGLGWSQQLRFGGQQRQELAQSGYGSRSFADRAPKQLARGGYGAGSRSFAERARNQPDVQLKLDVLQDLASTPPRRGLTESGVDALGRRRHQGGGVHFEGTEQGEDQEPSPAHFGAVGAPSGHIRWGEPSIAHGQPGESPVHQEADRGPEDDAGGQEAGREGKGGGQVQGAAEGEQGSGQPPGSGEQPEAAPPDSALPQDNPASRDGEGSGSADPSSLSGSSSGSTQAGGASKGRVAGGQEASGDSDSQGRTPEAIISRDGGGVEGGASRGAVEAAGAAVAVQEESARVSQTEQEEVAQAAGAAWREAGQRDESQSSDEYETASESELGQLSEEQLAELHEAARRQVRMRQRQQQTGSGGPAAAVGVGAVQGGAAPQGLDMQLLAAARMMLGGDCAGEAGAASVSDPLTAREEEDGFETMSESEVAELSEEELADLAAAAAAEWRRPRHETRERGGGPDDEAWELLWRPRDDGGAGGRSLAGSGLLGPEASFHCLALAQQAAADLDEDEQEQVLHAMALQLLPAAPSVLGQEQVEDVEEARQRQASALLLSFKHWRAEEGEQHEGGGPQGGEGGDNDMYNAVAYCAAVSAIRSAEEGTRVAVRKTADLSLPGALPDGGGGEGQAAELGSERLLAGREQPATGGAAAALGAREPPTSHVSRGLELLRDRLFARLNPDPSGGTSAPPSAPQTAPKSAPRTALPVYSAASPAITPPSWQAQLILRLLQERRGLWGQEGKQQQQRQNLAWGSCPQWVRSWLTAAQREQSSLNQGLKGVGLGRSPQQAGDLEGGAMAALQQQVGQQMLRGLIASDYYKHLQQQRYQQQGAAPGTEAEAWKMVQAHFNGRIVGQRLVLSPRQGRTGRRPRAPSQGGYQASGLHASTSTSARASPPAGAEQRSLSPGVRVRWGCQLRQPPVSLGKRHAAWWKEQWTHFWKRSLEPCQRQPHKGRVQQARGGLSRQQQQQSQGYSSSAAASKQAVDPCSTGAPSPPTTLAGPSAAPSAGNASIDSTYSLASNQWPAGIGAKAVQGLRQQQQQQRDQGLTAGWEQRESEDSLGGLYSCLTPSSGQRLGSAGSLLPHPPGTRPASVTAPMPSPRLQQAAAARRPATADAASPQVVRHSGPSPPSRDLNSAGSQQGGFIRRPKHQVPAASSLTLEECLVVRSSPMARRTSSRTASESGPAPPEVPSPRHSSESRPQQQQALPVARLKSAAIAAGNVAAGNVAGRKNERVARTSQQTTSVGPISAAPGMRITSTPIGKTRSQQSH